MIFVGPDTFVSFFESLSLEWRFSNQKCVQNTPDGPNVYFIAMSFFGQDFRSDIIGRSAQSALAFAFKVFFCGQSKITEFDLEIEKLCAYLEWMRKFYLHVIVEENIA